MSELGLHMEVEPPRRPDPEKRGRGPLIAALVIFTLVLLAVGAFFFRDQVLGAAAEDYTGSGGNEVIVQVQEGQTLSDIGATLKEEGVVASAQSFIPGIQT